MDCSLPGSSVHGICQARILEWVAFPFSRASSQPRNHTHVSCIGRRILYHWATKEVQFSLRQWFILLSSLACQWRLSLPNRPSFLKVVWFLHMGHNIQFGRRKELNSGDLGFWELCSVVGGNLDGRECGGEWIHVMYDQVPLLSSWNYHNTVNQLYSNINFFLV